MCFGTATKILIKHYVYVQQIDLELYALINIKNRFNCNLSY
jgi:hypothetical protein